MRSIKCAFLKDNKMNEVRVRVIKETQRHIYFRLVSDYKLTEEQLLTLQTQLGFAEVACSFMPQTDKQKTKLGKNVHEWSCFTAD